MTSAGYEPLVSVIIPAYNAAEYINEAVESVLSQTYGNLEIIVIDDGSTDNTAACVSSAFESSIIILRQCNNGPSSARNRGIEVATGKYIAFLDADDIWFPDKISEQVNLMEAYPDVGMVFGNSTTLKDGIAAEKSHFELQGLDCEYFGDPVYYQNAFKKLFYKNIIMTQTVMVRKSTLERTNGFDTGFRFAEDLLLWLDIAKISKVAYQFHVVAFRRRHEGNLTNNSGEHFFIWPNVYKKIEELHGDLLAQLDIDIYSKIAASWYYLGLYKIYEQGSRNVSKYFLFSLKAKPTAKCVLYLLISILGLCPLALWMKKKWMHIKNKKF
ncbi:glycosyltransferase family A protein [Desulfobacter postgatei]|jgi:glycosyltransferase involved in cell wall biosynthesis|uniref:glycosyltransferase family 2 protein n=1 Tax=Desulfobacter postgatei TaxID=2293 RepID=UPI002A369D50|nr:glycosyltransferase family A protein [Desulfobacter postgatei]MDX9964216.1 glycosyltransferase family A protein [Desulfobacter postgatei]